MAPSVRKTLRMRVEGCPTTLSSRRPWTSAEANITGLVESGAVRIRMRWVVTTILRASPGGTSVSHMRSLAGRGEPLVWGAEPRARSRQAHRFRRPSRRLARRSCGSTTTGLSPSRTGSVPTAVMRRRPASRSPGRLTPLPPEVLGLRTARLQPGRVPCPRMSGIFLLLSGFLPTLWRVPALRTGARHVALKLLPTVTHARLPLQSRRLSLALPSSRKWISCRTGAMGATRRRCAAARRGGRGPAAHPQTAARSIPVPSSRPTLHRRRADYLAIRLAGSAAWIARLYWTSKPDAGRLLRRGAP